AGLDEPDGGQVEIAGHRLSRRPEGVRAGIRARHIGMVMQSGNLIDHLTIAENIRLQRRLAGQNGGEAASLDMASRLGLSAHWNALPAELSGGEAARAGLAVALSAGAPILLCHEPTAGDIRWPALGPPDQLRPANIAMAFQGPSLVPFLDVAENVALPLSLLGKPTCARDAAIAELARFGLAELAEKLPDELSGGQ